MEKSVFRQIFKEILDLVALFILMFFGATTLVICVAGNYPIINKVILVIIFYVYAVVWFTMFAKTTSKRKKQEAQIIKEKKILEIEERYKCYIDLVNVQVQKTLEKLGEEVFRAFDVNTSPEYLISFDDYKDWICESRVVNKLDSFTIASCLMYSIIDDPIITIKGNKRIAELEELEFNINLDVAMNCALQIISEPTTYYDDHFAKVERKNQKVNASDWLNKNSDLYQRITEAIYYDELEDERTSIMQFSNLLRLIYLNCE